MKSSVFPPLDGTYEQRDPIELFGAWFADALGAGIYLPEAICLSTATPDGAPSSRMVLLKAFGPGGFYFYTNYESRKAAEMELNPRAALLSHWAVMERQVRIEGPVVRASEEESLAYFRTRDRGSQIGAWASRQSRQMSSRGEFEDRIEELEQRFDGTDVPLPGFWGGYRLDPLRIEFWQGRPSRLHDRLLFTRAATGSPWQVARLYP
jgi:pyridoxamine 5'-phosphate oxidase